ncbi:MAG: hypothetical protein OEZ25_02605 [Candidatus Bathyarchaeota archaeon]|nr:hypothetical protein [Candidatus Bathyarchaeota archaeon]
MSQVEGKPCIQKRVKMWFVRRLQEPMDTFFLCLFIFSLCSLLYIPFIETLDYSRVKDIVDLIVQTDGVVIAFSGVIAGLILKELLKESQIAKAKLSDEYKRKRNKIIYFVATTFIILIFSIYFGIAVIMTRFVYFILLSIIFLFTGIIELFTTLVNSVLIFEFLT